MIKTLTDRIAVRHLQKPGKIGSIWMPELKSHRVQGFVEAEVLCHGSKVTGPKKGQKVLVSELAGDAVIIDGVQIHIMRQREIVGIV